MKGLRTLPINNFRQIAQFYLLYEVFYIEYYTAIYYNILNRYCCFE